jgi:hypothetical protein
MLKQVLLMFSVNIANKALLSGSLERPARFGFVNVLRINGLL